MNCDPIARWYRWLEYLGMGRALERRRFEFLPLLSKSTSGTALLLGDGDGRFLAALLEVNRAMTVDYVDSSAEMLVLARERVARSGAEGRARFFQADALHWEPPTGSVYNLVVTHFFLDCLTEAELLALLARLTKSIAPDACWIVSEFRQPLHGLPAWRARLWIGGLYRVFGWFTGLKVRRLPEHRAALASQGFRLEREIIAEWGLLVSEWWRRRD